MTESTNVEAVAEYFKWLTIDASSFVLEKESQIVTRTRLKPPNLGGKQRNSNVPTVNPDIELLNTQIDILRGNISQKELVLKKLRESDNLKSKRIIQLDSQLKEAHIMLSNKAETIREEEKDSNPSAHP